MCLCRLLQVKSVNSSSSSTCANESTCWDGEEDEDVDSVVNLPVTTPENLYLMGKSPKLRGTANLLSQGFSNFKRGFFFPGMDLFEEALRRWEEALTFRGKQTDDDDESCASVKTGAGDAIAEQNMEVKTH